MRRGHKLTSMPVPREVAEDRVQRISGRELEGRTVSVLTEWEVIDGRAEPVRVDIRATDHKSPDVRRPVTADLVRRLPLGELIAGARRDLAWEGFSPGIDGDPGTPVRHAARTGPQRGRPLLADDLEAVAAEYRRAWTSGSESVTRAVAKRFNISPSTAGKRIMKARKAGLLEGAGPKR